MIKQTQIQHGTKLFASGKMEVTEGRMLSADTVSECLRWSHCKLRQCTQESVRSGQAVKLTRC